MSHFPDPSCERLCQRSSVPVEHGDSRWSERSDPLRHAGVQEIGAVGEVVHGAADTLCQLSVVADAASVEWGSPMVVAWNGSKQS